MIRLSSRLSLLAEALNDPDVSVRATLSHSPKPNELQREQFARDYLHADRPADALVWLQEPWGPMEHNRQGLLAETLGQLGRLEESAPIRKRMFDRTLSVFDLRHWIEHLPEVDHVQAKSHAHRRAIDHDDPATAAVLLLELGDEQAAEAKLLAEPALVVCGYDGDLLPMAKKLRKHARWRGETVIYRALVLSILERGYAKAYRHAAHHWKRLIEIDHSGVNLAPLPAHCNFDADVRSRHGRKTSFWTQVKNSLVAPD